MSNSKTLTIVTLLFLLSFLLRLSLISKGAFSIDCLSITRAGETLLDSHELPYHFGFGYPLTIILAAIFIFIGRLFSIADTVMAINFMSVVFGSLCIPAFYLLVKDLCDKTTALLSAVFFSLCPIFFAVSVFGIGHTPALFFLFSGLILLITYFQKHDLRSFLLSALFFGFSGAARLQDLTLFMPALTFFFFFSQKLISNAYPLAFKTRIRMFLLFIAISLITTLLFHLPYLLEINRTNYLDQLNHFQEVSLNRPDLSDMRVGFVYNVMFLTQTLSILGLLVSLLGFMVLARDNFCLFIFNLLWVVVPFLLFVQLCTILPRHQVLILPPFIMAQSCLLAKLISKGYLFKLPSYLVTILIIILTFWHYQPLFAYRHRHSLITEYSRWLGEMTEPNAQIIALDIDPFIIRYAHRKPLGRMFKDRYNLKDNKLIQYKNELETLIDKNIPIYITDTGLYSYDHRNRFSSFMKSNFELEYVGKSAYEDWHRDYLQFKVFNNALYRINKK